MLKLSNLENKVSSSNLYISGINGSKYVPVNLTGNLVSSVNELGKELLQAASDGDSNEISRLLTIGAPFAADWLGTSPLHLAAKGNHLNACEILLRSGISSNARTKVDRTPLHMACYEGHLDIAELLLKQDAEIDSTDLLGMTPLHWAVQNGHADLVKLLLKYGAQKHLENKFNLKPIDIARQINRIDIIEMIEEEEQEDPIVATENLTIEMANEEDHKILEIEDNSDELEEEARIEIDENSLTSIDEEQTEDHMTDSMKILQEHGITMLPNDDDNHILSSVMENGHSVVLTDVGKQVLDSVKAAEESNDYITRNLGKKNIITVTADEFLQLASNTSINRKKPQIIRRVDGKLVPKTIKRIVMKKNKLQPISPVPNILKQKNSTNHSQSVQYLELKELAQNSTETEEFIDVDSVVQQLAEAKRQIEDFKQKLMQKEAEAEEYKRQLNLLLGNS